MVAGQAATFSKENDRAIHTQIRKPQDTPCGMACKPNTLRLLNQTLPHTTAN